MRARTDSLTESLSTEQIGKYGLVGTSCISSEGKGELYKGIEEYKTNIHKQKVRAYSTKYHVQSLGLFFDTPDPQFFRKKFIEYLKEHPFPEFNGALQKRVTHPEQANILMSDLFGKQGQELYQLALEEEMESKEFRNAVVIKSTSHFNGPKWLKRPVVLVAGPSGCGKSFAAKAAVDKANQFLPKIAGDMSGNNVIAADGGLAREVSQIRKLAIQVANNQGYTGIKDLHSQSKILEKMKHRVREAAFLSEGVGVVIPETFAKWSNPLSPIRKLMKRIDRLDDTKQIFARVHGHNPSNFAKIVSFMGSRRAWKTQNFGYQPLDLNKAGLPESKVHHPNGFIFGDLGSKRAEAWFKANTKDKLTMIITNDLILLKPDPQQPERWVHAEIKDDGAALFSERAYKEWQSIPESPSKPSLMGYCKVHAKTQIMTSVQFDLAIAKYQMEQRITSLDKKLVKEQNKSPANQTKIDTLLSRHAFLQEISRFDPEKLESTTDIEHMKSQVKDQMFVINVDDKSRYVLDKKTIRAVNKFLKVLDKASRELENIKSRHLVDGLPGNMMLKKELSGLKYQALDLDDREDESPGTEFN